MARAVALAEIEETPESDRLDGFPHPRTTRKLYGHHQAEIQFAEMLASDRLHHGWLIAGDEGIGKATLAYRMARFLLAKPVERDASGQSLEVPPDSSAFRQVGAMSHPGLLVLRRPWEIKIKKFKTEIPVEEVRRLRSFLTLTADVDQWRVVIIDTADDMNANAANAVLKSLEEPPKQTVFLLLTSSPGRLLPTIRSRCRTLDLQPLASEPLKKVVTQALTSSTDEVSSAVPAGEDWATLERLSGGSARRVLSLHATGGLDLYKKIHALIAALPGVDWAKVHALADEVSSTAAERRYELMHHLLSQLLARIIRAEATGDGRADDIALAARLIGARKLPAWAALWQTLGSDRAAIDALNLDKKTLILNTFCRLEAIARA
jgi:DNA polymerase III subunit delta'